MSQNFLTYFQLALGVWQILKSTLPGVFIQGVMGWLLSLALPDFFPAYQQLQHAPGCLFKRVKCVVLIKENSQSKTKRLTEQKQSKRKFTEQKQVTTIYHRSACTTSTNTTVSRKTSISTEDTESTTASSGPGSSESVTSRPTANHFQPVSTEDTESTTPSSGPGSPESVTSTHHVEYLGENFVVEKEGNKVFVGVREGEEVVKREMSYYISDRQWKKICQMEKKCFRKKDGKKDGKGSEEENEVVFVKRCQYIWEKICNIKKKCFKTEKADEGSEKENEVVFVKGCQYIWEKVATGKVMKFVEVLDDVILENNNTVLISNNVWFLPVDLSEKSEGKLPKLLNLVGMFFSTYKKTSLSWVSTSFSIASAILEFYTALRSGIYRIINKWFCRSVQYICNKLPYPVRRYVYLLFIWVENLKPRNDILLKVETRDLDVVIGGSAKINSTQEATQVDWLRREGNEYVFRCGCPIVMKAKYDERESKCTITVEHTSADFRIPVFRIPEQRVIVNCSNPDEFMKIPEQRVIVNCSNPDEFMKIGTFLKCLAYSKAGSLFKYDRNDNIVYVRNWRGSVRDYVYAGFPEIYTLRLRKVIV